MEYPQGHTQEPIKHPIGAPQQASVFRSPPGSLTAQSLLLQLYSRFHLDFSAETMVLLGKNTLSLSLLAIIPVVLAELEPHSARSYHQGHHSRMHKIRTDYGGSNGTYTKPSTGLRFPYGKVPVRGVNLGGWLVLEVSRLSNLVARRTEVALGLALDYPFVVRGDWERGHCR